MLGATWRIIENTFCIAAELLYFWTCSGTFLAVVLPAIDRGFPSFRFFIYFGLHGGVVLTSVVLIYGMGLYPDHYRPTGEPDADYETFKELL